MPHMLSAASNPNSIAHGNRSMQPHYLNSLFAPKSIAMFGATERSESVGKVVFENLLSGGFKGLQGRRLHRRCECV